MRFVHTPQSGKAARASAGDIMPSLVVVDAATTLLRARRPRPTMAEVSLERRNMAIHHLRWAVAARMVSGEGPTRGTRQNVAQYVYLGGRLLLSAFTLPSFANPGFHEHGTHPVASNP